MLTERALHDDLEDRVLAAIISEHPEWVEASGECKQCITQYRELLKRREDRAVAEREKQSRKRRWLSLLIERFKRFPLRTERAKINRIKENKDMTKESSRLPCHRHSDYSVPR